MATEKRLFDKKEAIKLLRGKCVGKYPSTFAMGLFAAADEIAKLPDVDAVEVVRCKDCKHYHTHNRSVRFDCKEVYCCRSALKKVGPDDFCSNGERKNNGTLD